MKKFTVFLSLVIFCLISCQENEPELSVDLPQWLKERIQYDEEFVSQNPKSWRAYGVWEKTEWKSTLYFEYTNDLSSSIFSPISFDGDTLSFLIVDRDTDYFKQKCCSEIVWYGNRIDEEYLEVFHGN